tara:strand:- start:323 stop:784 length:462 start_codon:yes stop_codon:yes gene_type:complete
MNLEIEKKFLVKELPEKIEKSLHIEQYYMLIDKYFVQRLRFFDNKKSIISLKQNCSGMSRFEFEYEIPLSDAKKIISLGKFIYIKKIRHISMHEGLKWEVDEFLGDNKGLVIAEVELENENQTIELPKWIGLDVTNQNKYYNYNLALNPYISW